MDRRFLTLGLLLTALLAAPDARGSVMVRMPIPQLAQNADLVVRGTVLDAESKLSGDGRRIFTDVTLQVTEGWKGAPARTVVIRVHGGTYGDIGQSVSGEAAFDPGQDVIVFLRRIPSLPIYRVEGMAQGKLTVQVDATKGELAAPDLSGLELTEAPSLPAVTAPKAVPVPVPELRAQVKRALTP